MAIAYQTHHNLEVVFLVTRLNQAVSYEEGSI